MKNNIIIFLSQKSLAGIFATSDGHPPKVGGTTESEKNKIICIFILVKTAQIYVKLINLLTQV